MTVYRIALVIIALLIAAPVQGQSLEERLRGHYQGKFIEVKVPLPAENAPLIVYPHKERKYDSALYRLKIERIGVGLEPGAIAMIKSVDASSKEITFDLVGVGFQLPLGGLPEDLVDQKVWEMGGGRIRFILDEPLESQGDFISQINRWLSPLVSTRSLATDDDLPPEMRDAVRAGIVAAGMNRKAV